MSPFQGCCAMTPGDLGCQLHKITLSLISFSLVICLFPIQRELFSISLHYTRLSLTSLDFPRWTSLQKSLPVMQVSPKGTPCAHFSLHPSHTVFGCVAHHLPSLLEPFGNMGEIFMLVSLAPSTAHRVWVPTKCLKTPAHCQR